MSTSPANDAAATPANDDQPAAILFAHGSRSTEANDAHRTTAQRLAAFSGFTVIPAFLELAEPDLSAAVRSLIEQDRRNIVIVPYFLVPGRHAREDLPRLADEARAEFPDASIELRPIFGDDPGIIDLLAAQLERQFD